MFHFGGGACVDTLLTQTQAPPPKACSFIIYGF
jgi:hypothetical protein